MVNIKERLGRTVRRLRSEADYSQESFAAAAGIHRTYMGQIERGKVAVTIIYLQKMANALRMTPSALLAEAEREH
jgi:transcriptional regulator with XRE-family HTH domain